MSASRKDFAEVTEFVRSMRGGSQSILVRASDGLRYIAKFSNNLQGPNLLFNESAGYELYRECGLSVPPWKPLLITDTFIDQNPDCWIQTPEGRLRPASGLCFGSQFLGDDGLRLAEILPETMFKRIKNQASFWMAWMIDICAEHADDRQAIFQQDAQGWWKAFFIDHGHMFGGPHGDKRPNRQESLSLDVRIYPDFVCGLTLDAFQIDRVLNVDRLWRKVKSLPQDWTTKSALDRVARCLSWMSSPRMLQAVLDDMLDGLRRRRRHESRPAKNAGMPTAAVLFPKALDEAWSLRAG